VAGLQPCASAGGRAIQIDIPIVWTLCHSGGAGTQVKLDGFNYNKIDIRCLIFLDDCDVQFVQSRPPPTPLLNV